MKHLLKVLTATLLAFSVENLTYAGDQVVKIYNWSDYISDSTIDNFKTLTGIRVIYDVYDSNEILEAKLLSGQSGYDIVVPTSDFLARQIRAGAYQKLDRSKIPNWKNLDPALLKTLDNYDPGSEYSVPYQWGTSGIAYNQGKVKAILGTDAPVDSYDLVFNPKYTKKLASCGISVLDSANEILPLVLNYMGLNPNSTNPEDYVKARALLSKVRGDITYFHSSRYITDLANGDLCVAIGWSGDAFQAKARAEEANNGQVIKYSIPKEGTAVWADMMAIPKDAKNVDAAHAWINYILDPKVGADITNLIWYSSPNKASLPYIHEEIRNNPGIFPSKETKLFTFAVLPNRIVRIMNREWSLLKAGR